MFREKFSKLGQVGETVTWAVATLIIIVILIVSIYVAGSSDLAEESLGVDRKIQYLSNADRIPQKSLFSYLLTQDGERIVLENLETEGKEGMDMILGEKILSLSDEEYFGLFLFSSEEGESIFALNDSISVERKDRRPEFLQKIQISEDKSLILSLFNRKK